MTRPELASDSEGERESPRRPALPPASVWLVDGFNVLHHSFFSESQREQWWTEPHRRRLVERIAEFAHEPASAERPSAKPAPIASDQADRDPADLVWVVFDGPRSTSSALDVSRGASAVRVQVEFADSADDWILRKVREATNPSRLAVVSVDRKLTARARHRGAWIVAPGEFLAHCGGSETDT